MRQQTLEPASVNQLSLSPHSSITGFLPSNDFPVDDSIEQTRQLFNHTGSEVELLLKVQAVTAAIHRLCADTPSTGKPFVTN